MSHNLSPSRIERFLKEFNEMGLPTILSLSILSLGLYLIIWIFTLNRLLEKYDNYAPEATRGISVLVILPFFWFFIMLTLKTMILTGESILLTGFEILTWTVIVFLVIKYLHDFSNAYCEFTRGQPYIWTTFFTMGVIGIVGVATQTIALYPLVFLNLFAVIGMQSELNSLKKSHTIRKLGKSYYKR